MLTHKTHRSAATVAAYFRDHLRPGHASTGEYLSSDVAEPAVWRGDVARYLGIEGRAVTEDAFLAATLGRRPVDLPEAFAKIPKVRAYLETKPLRAEAVRKGLPVVLPDGTQGTIDDLASGDTMRIRRQGRKKVDVMPMAGLRVRGAQPRWSAEHRLTQRQAKRVGFDMTLSVPKGFSLLLHAGDSRLDAAFDRALTRLMMRVEDEAFVRTRGRDRGVDDRARSVSLLWPSFKHETSRPVRQEDGSWYTDPHRHAHIFVFNTTRSDHDGKNGLYALEPGPINERFPYFEAVFDSFLADEVQSLGYGVHRRGQSFEIDGVTTEMVRAFSTRTAEIEKVAAELGLSEAQKANAGVFLRARKKEAPVEDMRSHMTERCSHIVERLDRLMAEAETAVSTSRLAVEGQEEMAAAAVGAAIGAAIERSLQRGLERKNTIPLDRFMRDALIHAAGRATEQQILSAARDRKGLFIEPNARGDRFYITTREILEDEQRLVAAMRRGRGCLLPLAESVDISERLNERQQKALEHVLLSKDRLTSIRGRPGVGKSWVIEDLHHALSDRGISVVPLAPTVAASRGALREAGLTNANTVAAFLDGRSEEAKGLRQEARAGVIVVDEAGMLGTMEFRRLLERAEQLDARVVAIGDTGQLGTVARGDGLRLLEKHGLPAADINEILRQRDPLYRAAVEAFSAGDVMLGMERAIKAGFIVDLEGAADDLRVDGHPEAAAAAVRKLAADRAASEASEAALRGKSFMAVVPTHALGADVSRAIRARYQASGMVKKDAVELSLYWPASRLQADNAEYRHTLEAGEFAVMHRDVPEAGLRAGERLDTVEDENGRHWFKRGDRVIDSLLPPDSFEIYRRQS
ncbi:MAG: MobF family relaxase, partial [Myxococcota bacterium]